MVHKALFDNDEGMISAFDTVIDIGIFNVDVILREPMTCDGAIREDGNLAIRVDAVHGALW